jgi:signal transduction histidine kinase
MIMRLSMLFCLALLPAPALAAAPADSPKPTEAKAMLDRAVAYYNAHGRKDALDAFNKNTLPFSSKGLYVFCIGPDRRLVADGEYREYIGQSADLIKDSSGKMLGQAMWDAAQKGGAGELHYSWFNPATRLIEPKVSFLQKAGDDVCGVGTYDPK